MKVTDEQFNRVLSNPVVAFFAKRVGFDLSDPKQRKRLLDKVQTIAQDPKATDAAVAQSRQLLTGGSKSKSN